MKRLIIHPGIGKTATSAIQNYAFCHLTNGVDELQYSPYGLIDECHNGFADSHPKFSKIRYDMEVIALLSMFDIDRIKDVLISTEFFVNSSIDKLTNDIIYPLKRKGVKICVILVVRNYPLLMISAYLQALKTGYGLVFGESLLEYTQRNIEIFRVVYQLKRMASIQADEVTLIEYDRHKKYMVHKFFEVCGHDLRVPNDSKIINPSLLPEFVPLIRNFDKFHKALGNKRDALINSLMDLSIKYHEVSYNGDFLGILQRNGYEILYNEDMRIAKSDFPHVNFL